MKQAPTCDASSRPKVPDSLRRGVNLPWRRYGCDFGTNAWRLGGLTQHDAAPVRRRLDEAAEAGATTLRWFLFCDGRAGIDFSPSGWPVRLQPAVLEDVGRALALAASAGLTLVPVLFDFLWARPGALVDGVQIGGRAALLRDALARHQLTGVCVEPLVTAFGSDRRLACWDLCNEPEWMCQPRWPPDGRLSRRLVRTWLGELTQRLHWSASQPVTVGLATARGLPLVDAVPIDLVQVHWYDRHDRRSPLEVLPTPRPPRPVILGEFPSAGSTRAPATIIAAAHAAGYAGAWGWSLLAADTATDTDALLDGLRATRHA